MELFKDFSNRLKEAITNMDNYMKNTSGKVEYV